MTAREPGESYVKIAVRPDVREVSTPFWYEYSLALESMVLGKGYCANEFQPHGQEKYWMGYLRLIESASNGWPLDDAIAEIDRLFTIRNTDKSIKDDVYQIEGSGEYPAKWDFRRRGLLNYIRFGASRLL